MSFNFIPLPLAILSKDFLAASSTLLADSTIRTPLQATSVLAADGSALIANSNLFVSGSSVSVLAASANILAATKLFLVASTTLSTNSTITPNAILIGQASTRLASSATLRADTIQQLMGTATLAGTSLVLILMLATATLAGNSAIIASSSQIYSHSALLSSSASIIANSASRFVNNQTTTLADSTLLANLSIKIPIAAVWSSSSGLLADMLVRTPPGGSSRFFGPFSDLIDQPAPNNQIKRRKRITKPRQPPEASIPAIPEVVPLPPTFVREQPLVQVKTKPIGTFQSPVESFAPKIKHEIASATDESTDIEDAVMILKMLDLI